MLKRRLPELLGEGPEPSLLLVSSLAVGADQIVATHVLSVGGQLKVVVPCVGYENTFTKARDRQTYERLLARAASVVLLNYQQPSEVAFFAAGRRVVDEAEWLLAVWDGLPAQGLGGTADVVAYARQAGKHVEVVWPAGVTR